MPTARATAAKPAAIILAVLFMTYSLFEICWFDSIVACFFAAHPHARPVQAESTQDGPQQRQADADDVVMITFDADDVSPTQTVDGERTGDLERLSGADIGLDLRRGKLGKVHGG